MGRLIGAVLLVAAMNVQGQAVSPYLDTEAVSGAMQSDAYKEKALANTLTLAMSRRASQFSAAIALLENASTNTAAVLTGINHQGDASGIYSSRGAYATEDGKGVIMTFMFSAPSIPLSQSLAESICLGGLPLLLLGLGYDGDGNITDSNAFFVDQFTGESVGAVRYAFSAALNQKEQVGSATTQIGFIENNSLAQLAIFNSGGLTRCNRGIFNSNADITIETS